MARILVIDDEPQVRTMLKEIFEDEGYQVVTAADGEEGLKLYRYEPADLVVTDIVMPEKEGLATIRELRQISPEVKIIAISGGGRVVTRDFLRVAQAFGAKRVFSKPIATEELLRAIAGLLE
ncbi:MAG: response regulator [bacterium]